MISERKKEANRRNASLSTGPKTEEGKRISRANAVTHGFCAVIVDIPDEDPAVWADREADWQKELNPHNKASQAYLVKTAVKHTTRLDRLDYQHNVKLANLAKSAKRRLKNRLERKIEASQRLFATDSDKAVRTLKQSSEGCQYLIDRFTELLQGLIWPCQWTRSDKTVLAKLRGLKMALEPDGTPVPHSIDSAFIAGYYEIKQKLFHAEDPKYYGQYRYDTDYQKQRDITDLPVTEENARKGQAAVLETIHAEIAELNTLKAERLADEALDIDGRILAMRFDNSDDGKLMHRYEMEHERALIKCLNEVAKMNKNDRQKPQPVHQQQVTPNQPSQPNRAERRHRARNEATARRDEVLFGRSIDTRNPHYAFGDVSVSVPKPPNDQQ